MSETSNLNQQGRRAGVVTPPLPQAELEKLEQLYTLRERDEVTNFIQEHPFLVPVLLEAPEKIKPYFGDTPLFLEVYTDPEESNWVFLCLRITRQTDWEKAYDKLDELAEAWIFKFPPDVIVNLHIDVDYE